MQKTYYNIGPNSPSRSFFILGIILLATALLGFSRSQKEVVSFHSSDSLLITADHYFISDTLPYLILLHEQGSSRGEFESIAERFQKMDYNCLAVDLRNGGNANFISNETVRRWRQGDYGLDRTLVEDDIRASVDYAFSRSGKKVVLLGSGATGSLSLKITKEMDQVKGVIALSPGEFFRPWLMIEDTIAGLQKPVLITSTQAEFPYIEQMLSGVKDDYKTIFKPAEEDGIRGTNCLTSRNPANGEYWLAILLFFKEFK